MINDTLMFQVMQKAAALNALCCIHAENGSAIDIVVSQMIAEGKTMTREINEQAMAYYATIPVQKIE